MHRIACLLLFALCAGEAGFACCAPLNSGDEVAFVVPRGEPRILMTEIWTARADGSDPTWIKTFLGKPGDLFFLSQKSTFVYLERGLRQAAFGGHLVGGRTIPMVRNRVWSFSPDESKEVAWPLPPDLHAENIAVTESGYKLAVVGFRGGFLSEGEWGLWIVDEKGRSSLLLPERVSGPLEWSADESRILFWNIGKSERMSVDTATGSVSTYSMDEMPERPDFRPVHSERRRDEMRGVLTRIGGMALARYGIGHYGSHRGEYPKARDMYRDVKDVFKSLPKGSYEVSKGSCRAYVAEMDRLIHSRIGKGASVCAENTWVCFTRWWRPIGKTAMVSHPKICPCYKGGCANV